MGLQRALLFVRLLICLATGSLALTACTQEQAAGGILEAVMLADPDDAHNCLQGVIDASNGEAEGTCWVLIHSRYAQHFCKQALEAEVPKPFRWEEQPVSDPVLTTLIKSVPGSGRVLRPNIDFSHFHPCVGTGTSSRYCGNACTQHTQGARCASQLQKSSST